MTFTCYSEFFQRDRFPPLTPPDYLLCYQDLLQIVSRIFSSLCSASPSCSAALCVLRPHRGPFTFPGDIGSVSQMLPLWLLQLWGIQSCLWHTHLVSSPSIHDLGRCTCLSCEQATSQTPHGLGTPVQVKASHSDHYISRTQGRCAVALRHREILQGVE